MEKARIAIVGASGYGGAELVRLAHGHPQLSIAALCADRRAGEAMGAVFPHLAHLSLPDLVRVEDIDPAAVDVWFLALPHATAQEVAGALPSAARIVDLSADFRLKDPAVYEAWYGRPHAFPALLAEAIYGLTEIYREDIRRARLVACTGCNAITGQLAVRPLLRAGVIDPDEIVISLITGMSGAGRGAKEGMLFSEVSEGAHPYALSGHRHAAEFEQEFAKDAGRPVRPTFVPHLLPQNRGILASCYLKGDAEVAHAAMRAAYADEPFVHVLPMGQAPGTRHVRGSNMAFVSVVADRRADRLIAFCATDNLMKGAAGQAVQNANLMLGFDETSGLSMTPMFP